MRGDATGTRIGIPKHARWSTTERWACLVAKAVARTDKTTSIAVRNAAADHDFGLIGGARDPDRSATGFHGASHTENGRDHRAARLVFTLVGPLRKLVADNDPDGRTREPVLLDERRRVSLEPFLVNRMPHYSLLSAGLTLRAELCPVRPNAVTVQFDEFRSGSIVLGRRSCVAGQHAADANSDPRSGSRATGHGGRGCRHLSISASATHSSRMASPQRVPSRVAALVGRKLTLSAGRGRHGCGRPGPGNTFEARTCCAAFSGPWWERPDVA